MLALGSRSNRCMLWNNSLWAQSFWERFEGNYVWYWYHFLHTLWHVMRHWQLAAPAVRCCNKFSGNLQALSLESESWTGLLAASAECVRLLTTMFIGVDCKNGLFLDVWWFWAGDSRVSPECDIRHHQFCFCFARYTSKARGMFKGILDKRLREFKVSLQEAARKLEGNSQDAWRKLDGWLQEAHRQTQGQLEWSSK